MIRHFTVTGFVVEGDGTLLHWHRKSQMWLPPGGHIEPNEDPVQAVLREVLEETGITAEVIPGVAPYVFDPALSQLAHPHQLPPSLTILVEDIPARPDEAAHEHIDLIYAVRALPGTARVACAEAFERVTEAQLRRRDALPVASCGADMPVSEDVRVIALAAIALVRSAE